MYDTVHFFIPDVPHTRMFIATLKRTLGKYTEFKDQGENYSISGKLGNLRVTFGPSGLFVKGSVAKYKNGANYYGLHHNEMIEVLDGLSTRLGVNFFKAKVTRLDIAATFKVDKKPEHYFDFLMYRPRMKKGRIDSSLYFKNKRKVILFYDKNIEARSFREDTPEWFRGANALRLELRYVKKLEEQLGQQVFGADLADEQFYDKLVGKWRREYNLIQKKSQDFDVSEVDTFSGFMNMISRQGAVSLGDSVWDKLDSVNFKDRSHKSRVKNKLRQLLTEAGSSTELIDELYGQVCASFPKIRSGFLWPMAA